MTTARFDPYAVLGVDHSATDAEITAAYRTLVRRLHPDTRDPATRDGEHFTTVLAAYALLRDPQTRATYDRTHSIAPAPRTAGTAEIPVHIHQSPSAPPHHAGPWLRAGPVRRHR